MISYFTYHVPMMKQNKIIRHGFTIVELAVVILIIGIIATIAVVSYNGIQKRAINNTLLSDLEQASVIVESYALKNGGAFPDDEYLRENIKSSPDVHVSIIVKSNDTAQTPSEPETPQYINLSPVQNAVLFHKMCTDMSQIDRPDAPGLKYGQGRDAGGNVTTYMWGPNFCNVYNKDNIKFNSSWSAAGGELYIPVTAAKVQNHINNISFNDAYFPDFKHVVQQYYQAVHDQFLAQGGSYPITVFWDGDWCQVGQSWCTAYEALPELPPSGSGGGGSGGGGSGGSSDESASTQTYCILAVNTKHPETSFSFSSETLNSRAGNCGSDD